MKPRVLVITLARKPIEPWWFKHLDVDTIGCELHYRVIALDRGRPAGFFSRGFPRMALQILSALRQARREGYRYVFTFECDWTSFIIAGVQTALRTRRPHHVILQFIMREREETLRSRLKYAFMRWCFSSVYRCVCSARQEADYYVEAFTWQQDKVMYVPFHTDPAYLERRLPPEEDFVLAAGRTFRDYATLIDSFEGSRTPLTIVASPSSLGGRRVPSNVTIVYDIPLAELNRLMSRAMIVVLPLEQRRISIGQTVLLEAMTMGKPVVATRVAGTCDYIDHMETGLLVPPYDARALREAVDLLAGDPALRARLGRAAHAMVMRRHLPAHYAAGVSTALQAAQRAAAGAPQQAT